MKVSGHEFESRRARQLILIWVNYLIFEEAELISYLSKAKRLVIIGIGNLDLGDDGVGVYISNELYKKSQSAYVLNGGMVPENITHKIRKLSPSHILLIDAADFKSEPGSFILARSDDVVGKSISTHQLPLSLLMQYLEHEFNADVRLLCIQIKEKIPHSSLSSSVLSTANNLINLLLSYLPK